MVEAITNLALFVVTGLVTVVWIAALASSDGHCHYGSCEYCPYAGDCPWGRKR